MLQKIKDRAGLDAALLLLIIIVGLVLSACGQNPTPTQPTLASNNLPVPLNQKIASQTPFTLKVWFAEDYYNQPPIVSLIADFQKAYPNIKIEVDHAVWDDMRDKVRSAVSFGQSPDVVHQHAFAFGAQGYAEPLTSYWQSWGAQSRFVPSAMQDTIWNGVSYGVPLDINCTFLIYNKAFFDQAKLPYPSDSYTYTQMLEDAKKLTLANGSRYGVAFNNGVWNMFGHLVSNGGSLLDDTGGTLKAKLDSASNLAMLTYISEAINKYKVAPKLPITQAGTDPVDLFLQGKVAMFFTGPWDLAALQQGSNAVNFSQVGTAMMPRGLNGQTVGSVQGGGSLFIPKGAKHPDAAFEFMKWAASDKYQLRLAKEMARIPVISSLYKDPYFSSQPLLQPFFRQLETAHPYTLEAFPEAQLSWENAIFSILNGSSGDPAAILKQANQDAQKALNLAQGQS